MKLSVVAASLCASLLAVACSSKPEPAKPAPAPEAPAQAPMPPEAIPPAVPAIQPSQVVTEKFHSDALGVDKSVVVYLPQNYDNQPNKRWPVFYYLHGLGGNETNWTKHGQLQKVADDAHLEAIVVMPDGDDGFYIDSPTKIDYDACLKTGAGMFAPEHEPHETNCVRQRNYDTYVARDLVGFVDGKYRTLARRDARAIAGLSMGGFGAMSIGLGHADLFAAAASHSGAVALLYAGPRPFAAGQTQLRTKIAGIEKAAGPIGAWLKVLFTEKLATWKAHDVVELATKLPTGQVALYFDCGTEDDFALQDNVQYVHEALTSKHVEHEFFLGPGKHNFEFWTARLPKSLAFLVAHTAKAE